MRHLAGDASNAAEPPKPPAPLPADLRPPSEIPYYTPAGGGDCRDNHKRDPYLSFLGAYRKLGPIFRCRFIGREVIAMAGVAANEAIWSNNDYWDYAKTNEHFREQFDATYLNQLEGPAFYKKRRRTVQGFKPSVLIGQTPGMSRVLFKEVDAVLDGPVEMRAFMMRLYICMTGRVLMQTDLPKGMDRTMAISNRDMLRAPSLGRWRHLFYWKPSRLWRRRKIFKFLGEVLDARAQNAVQKDDILSLVLGAHPKNEPPIPRQELIYDLSQLIMGGSTTTSQVLLWTLLMLDQNPAWLAELREELKGWDPFNFTGMAAYPKLKATLLEAERLRPPGPALVRTTARDFAFEGYLVPKNTPVLHLQVLGHFLPECYEDPLVFRPQRFLENPALPLKNVHGIFGGGAHACLGQPLVRVLTPLLVADLVTRYDIRFEQAVTLDPKLDVVVTPVAKKLMARITPRPVA